MKIYTIIALLLIMLVPASTEEVTSFRFVCAKDYPPFCWEDEQGVHGIILDFVEVLLEESLAVSVEYEVLPWARCQLLVKDGQRDAMLTIPTPTRNEYTLITETATFNSNFVIWTGANNPKIDDIKEVTSLEILAEKDDLINTYILGGGWHNEHLGDMKRKTIQSNSTDILKLLSHNRADIYIEQEALMRYQMGQSEYGDNIVMIPNVLDQTSWHLMISRKSEHAQLIDRLNKLLEQMEKSGELQKLQNQIFSKYFSE